MGKSFSELNKEMNAYCTMPTNDPRVKGAIEQMQLGICSALGSAELTSNQKESITSYVSCFGLESGVTMSPEVNAAMETIGRSIQNDNVKTL